MKKTEGFVTADGTFFESEKEAALHEAEWKLRAKLSEYADLRQDAFLAVVLGTIREMKEYINAHEAASERYQAEDEDRGEAEASREAEAVDSIGHISSTEEDLASLLKLPLRGPKHVPNVGSRPRSKKVSHRRQVDGS